MSPAKAASTAFRNVTSLPRPTQRPRPPFYVAALATKESFERAGAAGHSIMAIPMTGGAMAELIDLYRVARRRAGHTGRGTVMLAFHMFCHADQIQAERIAREPLNRYLRSLVAAASDWMEGRDVGGLSGLRQDHCGAVAGNLRDPGGEMRRLDRYAGVHSRHGARLPTTNRGLRDRVVAGQLQRHQAC